MTRRPSRLAAVVAVAVFGVGCSGDDDSGGDSGDGPSTSVVAQAKVSGTGASPQEAGAVAWVDDAAAAVDAVEEELGAGQRYFEVTATPRFTNVFVAIDDGASVRPFLYVDGSLEPPGPDAEVESGFTFTADAVQFDSEQILGNVVDELPDSTIESLSVEGGDDGTVRYVVGVRSGAGGSLDVIVGPNGAVLAVIPL